MAASLALKSKGLTTSAGNPEKSIAECCLYIAKVVRVTLRDAQITRCAYLPFACAVWR